MAGKQKDSSDTKWGPYFDTYDKNGGDGFIYEQEVPAYREQNTPHGMFGIPAGHVLTFKDKTVIEDGQEVVIPVAVLTPKKDLKYHDPVKTDRRVEV